MKIVSCEAWPVSLTLQEPFTIAYGSLEGSVNYFLKIETDTNLVGYGCSAFDQEVTNENEESIKTTLLDIIIPSLIGEDPLSYASLLRKLYELIPNQPTALASADMALFDLLGKKVGLPLYRLFGASRSRIKTSITIGIQDVAATVEKAKMWKKEGYRVLKIKGGLSIEEDVEKLYKIREAVGKEIQLYFDANQGYTYDEAKVCIDTLSAIGAEFIEQPCNKRELAQFTHLKGKLPIMADEAVLGPEDALSLIQQSKPDLINIKLAKSGGILRAKEGDAIAQSASVPTMVGCMDEAGLGVSAALHMALASSNVAYADLDGHVEFIDDPSYNAVKIEDGYLYPNEKPGLGWQ